MRAVSDFDLRLFTVFKTVVEYGGLSASQSALNMSLSNISTHLANLEKRVGFKVCHRGRSGFKLTPGGTELYSSIAELFQSIDEFRSKTSLTKKRIGRELSLGIVDGLISEHQFKLQSAIQKLGSINDDIFIRIDVLSPDKLKSSLANGDVDFIVGPISIASESVLIKEAFHERMSLFCSQQHILADREMQKEKIFNQDYKFEFVSRGYLRESLQPAFIPNLETAAVVHTMEAAAMLILSGKYIGYLPDHFAKKWEDTNEMVRILPDVTSHVVPFGLMYRRDHKLPLPAKLLLEYLLSSITSAAKYSH
ncbi:LysR family transcriptional regulator [Rhizobium sp. KVB221]|uniref:LysR family transcriptional regulator n=1 Tax=Rhizobium setariae TaxID=2801340 RepID=A0A936YT44_9HYPH|nr:LysR family transcriptional regulator [Rhizobium setariae]MBL0374351.1 LysR family transcriptional regulator [Rhizobium setariae]